MKRLMIAIAMCVAAVAADAAQCEGQTQKGERCKRDAAEGSKFCIGHADQAKKAAPKEKAESKSKPAAKEKAEPKPKTAPKADAGQKEKDDGTCWAVTEAGTRCKHKKDGESDYCKQHGPDVKAKTPGGQCRALKWDGERCTRTADGDSLYCKQHRKQPAAQKAEKKATDKPDAAKAGKKKTKK